jgi:hypothetical protein
VELPNEGIEALDKHLQAHVVAHLWRAVDKFTHKCRERLRSQEQDGKTHT